MPKRCVYCNCQIADESVVDVCTRCGVGVWGEKMFACIIQSMEGAREKGDLFQGSVNPDANKPQHPKNPYSK